MDGELQLGTEHPGVSRLTRERKDQEANLLKTLKYTKAIAISQVVKQ